MGICQPELALLPYKSQKSKIKVSFYINPRAFINTSYRIKIPVSDYVLNNANSYTSKDTKYRIIDDKKNIYLSNGQIANTDDLKKSAIYAGRQYFNLEEGIYYYYELESGYGKQLIKELIKFEVKQGMQKYIPINHKLNEFKGYFNTIIKKEDITLDNINIRNSEEAYIRYLWYQWGYKREFVEYEYSYSLNNKLGEYIAIKFELTNIELNGENYPFQPLIYVNDEFISSKEVGGDFGYCTDPEGEEYHDNTLLYLRTGAQGLTITGKEQAQDANNNEYFHVKGHVAIYDDIWVIKVETYMTLDEYEWYLKEIEESEDHIPSSRPDGCGIYITETGGGSYKYPDLDHYPDNRLWLNEDCRYRTADDPDTLHYRKLQMIGEYKSEITYIKNGFVPVIHKYTPGFKDSGSQDAYPGYYDIEEEPYDRIDSDSESIDHMKSDVLANSLINTGVRHTGRQCLVFEGENENKFQVYLTGSQYWSNISDSEIQKCYYSCLNWINTIREEDI